ncbi:hypothetical protein SUGI_0221080 [Cryptomeria japonica]|nr:hypothetical protein SUGI_0221080 [Cryptomeria japonica]
MGFPGIFLFHVANEFEPLICQTGEDDDLGFKKPQRIIVREDDYRKRRLNRIISPDRNDAFAMGDKTPDAAVRTYADVMREEALKREKEETLRLIAKKDQEEKEKGKEAGATQQDVLQASQKRSNRRNRWDETPTPGRLADADATPVMLCFIKQSEGGGERKMACSVRFGVVWNGVWGSGHGNSCFEL